MTAYLHHLLDISPLNWLDLLCLFIAASLIGLERQIKGKPVGMRTSILICLGTYVFIALGRSLPLGPGWGQDPTRVMGQVITGIGFLGAGVMFSRDGAVVGVTSAAAIWILAAIGAIVGMGHQWLGLKVSILSVLTLMGISWLESSFKGLQKGVYEHLYSRIQDPSEPPEDP
ncbi:MAG: MgtC/SapB family protein [bacterium]|nr:MgtC/SapB family protein [bacterium]